MIQLERSMTHKWIIDKNVNSKYILEEFTSLVRNSRNGFHFEDLVPQTITQGRTPNATNGDNGSTITIGVRLLQACFYMLGYSTNLEQGRKTFMPSPMTINLLSAQTDEEKIKNYLVCLFCMQFPHPFDWTPDCFKIYFGRLITKLLLEDRIGRRLYIDEFIWFLPFIDSIDENRYNALVDSIIEYRSLSYTEKMDLFHGVEEYNNLFANVLHEINYYFLRLFEDCGVFELVEDAAHNDGRLFKFLHSSTPSSRTYRNDAYHSRKKHSGYVKLSSVSQRSAEILIESFSPFEQPSEIDGIEIFSREDWLTNLYQTEPLRYLACVNAISQNGDVLAIVNEMIRASKYGSRDGKEFENALKPFLELFKETINVEILSGAGKTDLLCTMEKYPEMSLYNMNVDAKTRASALEGVMVTRINQHMRQTNAKFCIIIAPRFSSGVSRDIYDNKIVTIRSEEFGNYCYKECTNNNNGTADFSSILDIINSNMGSDITNKVRLLTESRYGLVVR